MATISGTIDIRATPAEILAVIADVPAYPRSDGAVGECRDRPACVPGHGPSAPDARQL
jgi:hypothetical protein